MDDPSAYGLVRLTEENAVREFVEKPPADQIDTDLISAGAYVLERSVLDLVTADRNVSIEREVWPRLIGDGLYGRPHRGAYWLDIGTPQNYLQATFDIIEANVHTAVADRLRGTYLAVDDTAVVHGRVIPPAVVERGAEVAEGAHVGSLVVLGDGVRVGARTAVERSVVLQGAQIGADCVLRDCIVGPGVRVGDKVKIQNYALVYAPATLEPGVFVGPAVVLTNDLHPRSVDVDGEIKSADSWAPVGVVVKEGASLGARAVCVAPVTVGRWAMVGAGAVVIRDVPDFALVVGTPARQIGWVGRAGARLEKDAESVWHCPRTGERFVEEGGELREI